MPNNHKESFTITLLNTDSLFIWLQAAQSILLQAAQTATAAQSIWLHAQSIRLQAV